MYGRLLIFDRASEQPQMKAVSGCVRRPSGRASVPVQRPGSPARFSDGTPGVKPLPGSTNSAAMPRFCFGLRAASPKAEELHRSRLDARRSHRGAGVSCSTRTYARYTAHAQLPHTHTNKQRSRRTLETVSFFFFFRVPRGYSQGGSTVPCGETKRFTPGNVLLTVVPPVPLGGSFSGRR